MVLLIQSMVVSGFAIGRRAGLEGLDLSGAWSISRRSRIARRETTNTGVCEPKISNPTILDDGWVHE